MMKNRHLLFIGVIGAIILIVTGFWLWKRSGTEENQQKILSRSGFTFENAIGAKAPEFVLPDLGGNQVALGGLTGRSVVLFFTEGFMCNPCFTQLVALSKDERLNNTETVSFSIVIGDEGKWRKILAELPPLPPLKVLFDAGGVVSRSYDTLNLTSSMHKGIDNGHTYFVIDQQGIVRFALDDPYMGLRNDELVAEVEKLKNR